MIKVIIKKNNELIESITISGHSLYDVHGKDIVCASVSSIAITTVNGILNIHNDVIDYKENDGYLNIQILKHNNVVDSLIKNMIDLLNSLEKDYKKYINIKEEVSICHN